MVIARNSESFLKGIVLTTLVATYNRFIRFKPIKISVCSEVEVGIIYLNSLGDFGLVLMDVFLVRCTMFFFNRNPEINPGIEKFILTFRTFSIWDWLALNYLQT